MFKLLKNVLLIFICILGYLWIRKDSLVEHWLSQKLHTQVSVGCVSPRLSGIKIRHLCIHNRPTTIKRFPYALEAEYVKVRFSLLSMLISKKVEISDLTIQGASLTFFPFESNSSKTNWQLLWNGFLQIQELHDDLSYTSKIDTLPILIRRCQFINTRIQGFKSNQKDFPVFVLPMLEFRCNTHNPHLPSLDTAIKSLLYLAVEESIYQANLPGDIVKPLSKLARGYFISASRKKDLNYPYPSQSTEEVVGLIREFFFR